MGVWTDNLPVEVGKCPECGAMKAKPHPLDRCDGKHRGTEHPPLPLTVCKVSLQPWHPDSDLPALVRRVRWILSVEDTLNPPLSRSSLVKQLRKAVEDCDPNDNFPMREA